MSTIVNKGKDTVETTTYVDGAMIVRAKGRLRGLDYQLPFLAIYIPSDITPFRLINESQGLSFIADLNSSSAKIILAPHPSKSFVDRKSLEGRTKIPETPFWLFGEIGDDEIEKPRSSPELYGGDILYGKGDRSITQGPIELISHVPLRMIHKAIHNWLWGNPTFLYSGNNQEYGRFKINHGFESGPTWELATQLEYDLKVPTTFRFSKVENLLGN